MQCFGRGFAWLDTGTIDSLIGGFGLHRGHTEAAGLLVAAIEEIAFRRGFIDADHLAELAKPLITTRYGQYLDRLAHGKHVEPRIVDLPRIYDPRGNLTFVQHGDSAPPFAIERVYWIYDVPPARRAALTHTAKDRSLITATRVASP